MDGTISRPLAAHQGNAGQLLTAGRDLVRTAGQTGEVAVASARTIGYRTARIVQAFGDPAAMADPEFTRMGHEKVAVALKSGQAVANGVHDLCEAWQAWLFGQMQSTTRYLIGLSATGTPLHRFDLHQRYAQETAHSATASTVKLIEGTVRLAAAGLLPVHEAVSANARRLAGEHAKTAGPDCDQ